MRYALVLVGSLVAGCISAKAALLPGSTWRSNDPNPTAPLVETVPPENVPVAETKAREHAAELAPVGAAVSTASALGFLLGGAAPLLGIYGTFDENLLGPSSPPPPPADPHTVQ